MNFTSILKSGLGIKGHLIRQKKQIKKNKKKNKKQSEENSEREERQANREAAIKQVEAAERAEELKIRVVNED